MKREAQHIGIDFTSLILFELTLKDAGWQKKTYAFRLIRNAYL
jgi:hypothetical protein